MALDIELDLLKPEKSAGKSSQKIQMVLKYLRLRELEMVKVPVYIIERNVINGKNIYLGQFDTEEEALEVLTEFREKEILE